MKKSYRKILPTVFLVYAFGLLIFSLIYWTDLISNDRWDELAIRIIVMVLTVGFVLCLGISAILYQQESILRLLEDKEKQE